MEGRDTSMWIPQRKDARLLVLVLVGAPGLDCLRELTTGLVRPGQKALSPTDRDPEGHREEAFVVAGLSLDEYEEWLALFDDVGGEFGRVAAADVAH
jgi:hypothetical protein